MTIRLSKRIITLALSASTIIFFLFIPGFSQASQLTLAWDPNDPSPEGYAIYHRTVDQSYDYGQPIWTGIEATATVGNLEENIWHYFVVRAFEGELESADSEEVNTFLTASQDSDNDGLSDDDENDLYGTDPNNPDSDGDSVSDGEEVEAGTDPNNPGDFPTGATFEEAMEFGEVDINHIWTRINFEKSFANPVVVAGPIGHNGGDPSVIRIQNVNTTGFEMRLQEWDYLDGTHTKETVGYLVMEQGRYILDNGTLIEAASVESNAAVDFVNVPFNNQFNLTPVVMTTITSFNDTETVTVRVKEIAIDGFKLKMQEQEVNSKNHGTETLSYIAWEPSSGSVGSVNYLVDRTDNAVTHTYYPIFFNAPFASAPTLLAEMQTTDGGNTANVRNANKDEFSVDVWIDEEQSMDTETGHIAEIVGYMVFSH